MGKLDGKVAIVTGASRGIGAEISRLFAKEGAKVVCVARTLKEGDHILEGSLELTCAQIRESGGEATAIAANISLPEDCERLVEETKAAYGPANVLVNNAALTYFIPIKDFPLKPVATHMVGERTRTFSAEPTCPARHDRGQGRQHRKHIVELGNRAGASALQRRRKERHR